MKFRLVLLLSVVFFAGKLMAQEADSTKLLWIKQLSEYRDLILQKNPSGGSEIQALTSKWEELKKNEEELEEFISKIYSLSKVNSLKAEKVLSLVKVIMSDSDLANELVLEDIYTVERNIALIELMQLGVLEKDYPFKINDESDFVLELLKYGIRRGERIGEIGAGRGSFSLVLYKLQPNIELFVNELDENNLSVLQNRLENESELGFEDVKPILGEVESTNMEGYELDKVIIRNAFHHFTEKEKMLTSIKRSLAEDGHLYILEGTKELAPRKERCIDAMSEKQIVRTIEANGYELLAREEIGQDVLLKFGVN